MCYIGDFLIIQMWNQRIVSLFFSFIEKFWKSKPVIVFAKQRTYYMFSQ